MLQAVLVFGVEMWVITPPHMPGLGGVPAQDRVTYHKEAALEASVWELRITYDGEGNAWNGIQRDGGVCAKEVEYGHAIHCNAVNF